MPFITREDGEHFVVPSQRDVITARSNSQLKKELILRSENYGEYITLQKKNTTQYEVAFSPDPGYLLGESIWHHFNRPLDMIYCEAIPNTSEVILVIVKGGSVYLDGSFPYDSVVEELVVFLTQQNNFEIYTYGEVPISSLPEEGKLAFDSTSVKSFTALDQPVFPTLPLLKIYQLKLLASVLQEHGIGVFPVRKALIFLLIAGVVYYFYQTMSPAVQEHIETKLETKAPPVNPFQLYYDTMASPPPNLVVQGALDFLKLALTIPGWMPVDLEYTSNGGKSRVVTKGAQVSVLMDWAKLNKVNAQVAQNGMTIETKTYMTNRPISNNTVDLNETLTTLIDRVHTIYSGNAMSVGAITTTGKTKSSAVTITIQNISPMVLSLMGDQLTNLPIKVQKITATLSGNQMSATISLQVVGS